MSLEKALAANTAALETHTAVMEELIAAMSASTDAAAPKKKAASKPKAEKSEAEEPAEKSAGEDKLLDYALDIKPAVQLAAKKDRDATIETLAKFKDKDGAPVTKATALLESDYAAFLKALEKAVGDE